MPGSYPGSGGSQAVVVTNVLKASAKIGHGRLAKVRTGFALLFPGFPSCRCSGRKEISVFLRAETQKKSSTLAFCGGPRYFDEGVAHISRANKGHHILQIISSWLITPESQSPLKVLEVI